VHRQSTKRTATNHTPTWSSCTKITLAAHPACGESVRVVKGYGSDAVCVEMPNGDCRIVPVAWTSLAPPRRWRCLEGESRRLELEGLVALGSFVAARVSDCRKVGHFDKCGANVVPDGRGRVDESDESERGATAAVVEQARAPGARCGSSNVQKQQRRGTR